MAAVLSALYTVGYVTWVRYVLLIIYIYADPAQPLITAGYDLDDLYHYLSADDLSADDLTGVCKVLRQGCDSFFPPRLHPKKGYVPPGTFMFNPRIIHLKLSVAFLPAMILRASR